MISSISPKLPSTRSLLFGIWLHLRLRRRIQLGCTLILMLASGLAELVSLGAVLPFLSVLANPEDVWQHPLVHDIAIKAGLGQASQLVVPASAVFALAAVLAAVIRSANLWLNGRLAAEVGSDLSSEAYMRTLCQPYCVHIQSNSSTLINAMTNHVDRSVKALASLLQLLTALIVSAAILAGLFLVNWKIASVAAALFAFSYGLIAITARRQLSQNSVKIADAGHAALKAVQEGLGAIRDVLLDGNQSYYQELYCRADRPLRQLYASNQFLSNFPRFAIEGLGMVMIALLGAFLMLYRTKASDVVPLLGVLGLGAQRLLPSLQQAYSSWANIRGFNADLAGVYELLKQPLPLKTADAESLVMHDRIILEEVSFRYQPELHYVLTGLDLEILRGERIGFIGSTGSGKSTLIDLLMGLLPPSRGKVFVDGLDLYNSAYPCRLDSWRSSVAHVPQSIYLADSSIAENIAFGLPKQRIDIDRVKQAAERAQISSFIESLPHDYDSFVGERGVRLSGGQRQRIGIARALYKNASLIVLDEATSALDTTTEKAVMESLEGLSRQYTILIIAHRLSTLEFCDRVVKIEKGRLLTSSKTP